VKRSTAVKLSLVVTLAATLAACNWNDDDDCDDESLRQVVPVYQGDLVLVAQQHDAALPASGGFGTHLASCGG
jgi:hypothetical protein